MVVPERELMRHQRILMSLRLDSTSSATQSTSLLRRNEVQFAFRRPTPETPYLKPVGLIQACAMSVAELQAQIDSLSANILRHKQALKDLECSKSAAQCQLNAIRDPVARLPLEISSEIFIQCLSTRPRPGSRHAPMILANISTIPPDELTVAGFGRNVQLAAIDPKER
ncbi:hypothetical protein B0H17DRAFT_1189718 [Mycena rosella]|uniref:Uncharacterized protein n=1 Tax=Mycena rosella TaxID=1033263 RepID=A0AAD7F8Q2_MYCRO|nr:hypothetical protein B0H17DRAFT_1189718 [Mycena rosella]